MVASYQDTIAAQTAVLSAIAESGLRRGDVSVVPFHGIDATAMLDEVEVQFPGGIAHGSYAAIISAIQDSRSFTELASICIDRNLASRDPNTGELRTELAESPAS